MDFQVRNIFTHKILPTFEFIIFFNLFICICNIYISLWENVFFFFLRFEFRLGKRVLPLCINIALKGCLKQRKLKGVQLMLYVTCYHKMILKSPVFCALIYPVKRTTEQRENLLKILIFVEKDKVSFRTSDISFKSLSLWRSRICSN